MNYLLFLLGRISISLLFVGEAVEIIQEPHQQALLFYDRYFQFYEYFRTFEYILPDIMEPQSAQSDTFHFIHGIAGLKLLLALGVILDHKFTICLTAFYQLMQIFVLNNLLIQTVDYQVVLLDINIMGSLLLLGLESEISKKQQVSDHYKID